jgi:hypothetical protein
VSGGGVAFNEALDEGYRTYDIMSEKVKVGTKEIRDLIAMKVEG